MLENRLHNFCNMTEHSVILRVGKDYYTFPPSGQVARLVMSETEETEAMGIPCVRIASGTLYIPKPSPIVAPGRTEKIVPTYLIVSRLVLEEAIRQNHYMAFWLLSPDTGPTSAIRGARGEIIAVRRFLRA